MSGDWQQKRSLAECNKFMLENEKASDVTFIVSNVNGPIVRYLHEEKTVDAVTDNTPPAKRQCLENSDEDSSYHAPVTRKGCSRIFKAHKYMLISRSPVFDCMLTGSLAEKGDIKIEDVEPEAFQQMLKYIYTEEAELTEGNIMCILYVAKKYMLPGLVEMCEDFFDGILSVSNACVFLDQCLSFQEDQLINKCLKVIMFKTKSAFNPASAKRISHAAIDYILCQCKIATIKEADIFKFCVEWAKSACEKLNKNFNGPQMKNLLGSSLYRICFPQFTSAELADIVIPLKVLPAEDSTDIFQYLCTSQEDISPPSQFPSFNRYVSSTSSRYHCADRLITPENVNFLEMKITLNAFVPIMLDRILFFVPSNTKPEINPEMEILTFKMNGSNIFVSRWDCWFDENFGNISFRDEIEVTEGEYTFEIKMELQDGNYHDLKSKLNAANTKIEVTLKNNPYILFDITAETKVNHNDTFVEWNPVVGAHFYLHNNLLESKEN